MALLDSLKPTKSEQEIRDSLLNRKYEASTRPTFQNRDRYGDPYSSRPSKSPLLLRNPDNIKLEYQVDRYGNYTITERIGSRNYRPPTSYSNQEMDNIITAESQENYFMETTLAEDGESAVSGRRLIPKILLSPGMDRIFGGDYIDIVPNGFVNMDFGGRWQFTDNPETPIRLRRTGGFNYDQQMGLNVNGKIGEKLTVTANFDNNNTFDFQNNLKIDYQGLEEDIIKDIEIGNVSLPTSNSLIRGGTALFGLKTQMQFGKLYVTSVLSRQRGTNNCITSKGTQSGTSGFGAGGSGDVKTNEFLASDYEENRHFFLSHFFRDNYETWMSQLPGIFSGLNIIPNNVEVYVGRINSIENENQRSLIALADLGEYDTANIQSERLKEQMVQTSIRYADNEANPLFKKLTSSSEYRKPGPVKKMLSEDYEMKEGRDYQILTQQRKLSPNEYTIDPKLGILTLNSALASNEALAVSFQYQQVLRNSMNGKVGEMAVTYGSLKQEELVFMKLLRPNNTRTDNHTWDLMLKNVYSIGASNINQEGFALTIHYREDNGTGISQSFFQVGSENIRNVQLTTLLGLDRLGPNNDKPEDGLFDFLEGELIDSRKGTVRFPVLEPFGDHLHEVFARDVQDSALFIDGGYVYDELYDQVKIVAARQADKNKYSIKVEFTGGSFSSSNSNSPNAGFSGTQPRRIPLEGFQVSENSVTVTANGSPVNSEKYIIQEFPPAVIFNTTEYNNQDIEVCFEKADLFNLQTRWLSGFRFDYKFSDNINFGATYLSLNERQGGISTYTVGDEPISNKKLGLDVNYKQDSRLITKIIDALPLISTKEQSSVSFSGEFAQLIPGTNNNVAGEGAGYLDDFENFATSQGLGNPESWKLGATPQTDDNRFARSNDALGDGYQRARLAWYIADPSAYTSGNNSQFNISRNLTRGLIYVDAVDSRVLFTGRQLPFGNPGIEPVFDLAYFPRERGQYNFNPNEDLANGGLSRPSQNYGAITRGINTWNNWERDNVEYIEFWLLDPFIEAERQRALGTENFLGSSTEINSAALVLNVGQISEDLLPDGEPAFESALPQDGGAQGTTESEWGKIGAPSGPANVDVFFSNEGADLLNQDAGLDGLKSLELGENSEDELEKFFNGSLPAALANNTDLQNDPASDDFKHYNADDFPAGTRFVERYKRFNGMERNTYTESGQRFNIGTRFADKEDINGDRNVNGDENYFEYRVPLGNLNGDNPFVIDKQIYGGVGGPTWYQIRIPVKDFTGAFGNPSFEDMQFMRLYLTGFTDPVILRMADFQMVRSEWLKGEVDAIKPGSNLSGDSEIEDNFFVSTINVEQNSEYRVPPGIERNRNTSQFTDVRENEQSLRLCIDDLENGKTREVFRRVTHNLVNYGALKMFLHAESSNGQTLRDNELSAYVRLATDLSNHYYEIEVPLKVTSDENGEVWPAANNIDVPFGEFYRVKTLRNDSVPQLFDQVFVARTNNGGFIRVKGNPRISNVNALVIGVRNRSLEDYNGIEGIENELQDDLQSKSVCIWANELRVTDFDNKNGYATNMSMSVKLADIADVKGSLRYVSSGYGGLQDNISDRTRSDDISYSVSASMKVDKLIPGKHGLNLPVTVSKTESVSTPRWDPYNDDIPLEDALKAKKDPDDYKQRIVSRTTKESINMSGIGKRRVKEDAKVEIWDIENFNFSYGYSESRTSNQYVESHTVKNHNGSVTWAFSPGNFNIEPFKNIGFLKSPFLQLIKDFNFSPLPSSLNASGTFNRLTDKKVSYRGNEFETIDPVHIRYFNLNRNYGLSWPLTKSINLSYSAGANAVIDEPDSIDFRTKEYIRDSIIRGLRRLGRLKSFNQSVSGSYKIPFDKFPLTKWLSASINYSTGYTWTAQNDVSRSPGDSLYQGNTISNSRNRSLSSGIKLIDLYNKVPFLNAINNPKKRSGGGPPLPKVADTVKVRKPISSIWLPKTIFRTAMAFRSLDATYSIQESTTLPGFVLEPDYFGVNTQESNAPGLEFTLLGSQNGDIRKTAAQNDWLTRSSILAANFTQNITRELSLKSSAEPIPDLRISLTAKRSNTSAFNSTYSFNPNGVGTDTVFTDKGIQRTGSFTISYAAIGSAFLRDYSDGHSRAFRRFRDNLETIRSRIESSSTSRGEVQETDQNVIIPAFLAAYSGRSASKVALTPFPRIPIPNWRVDYSGLMKIPKMKELFSSFSLNHSYNSTYTVGNYSINEEFDQSLYPNLDLNNSVSTEDFLKVDAAGEPLFQISQVTIRESFAPLIGVNLKTKSNLTGRLDYKRNRDLTLQPSSSQLTEVRNNDISFDFGFVKSEMKLPFRSKGTVITLENDVNFKMTVTVRETRTVQRRIELDSVGGADISDPNVIKLEGRPGTLEIKTPQTTNGNINIQLRPQLSYTASKSINLTMYFNREIFNPLTQGSNPRRTSAFGVQVRWSLSQ